jgi:Tfp pilus assembly protein FimV
MMLPVTNDANRAAARAAELQRKIDELTMQLTELRTELQSVTQQLAQAALAAQLQATAATPGTSTELNASAEAKAAAVNRRSSPAAKIALFRRLFSGRNDAYAVRWTSAHRQERLESGCSCVILMEEHDVRMLPLTPLPATLRACRLRSRSLVPVRERTSGSFSRQL